jgi:hypothetical protein
MASLSAIFCGILAWVSILHKQIQTQAVWLFMQISQNPAGNEGIHKSLDDLRQIGDSEVDELVDELVGRGEHSQLYSVFQITSYDQLNQLKVTDEKLKSFLWNEDRLPDWADTNKMSQASALFRANGNEFLFMLGIVSLPYCYAAAKGAISLYHTEKIRKNTEKRLLDTTSFIIEIMKEGAFSREGNGFLAVKMVRLRHAIARFHLRKVPEVSDLQEMPINQEDMAGTNLAFSYIALKAMPAIGVKFSVETQNAYLHFWSVIGFMMGLKKELLSNDLRSAFRLEKRIAQRQFKPSKEGFELTRQLVNHYKAQIPNKATTLLIDSLMRHLLGTEVAKIIGLKRNTFFNPIDQIMALLPLFKKYIFPPVQSFELIVNQIEERQKALAGA